MTDREHVLKLQREKAALVSTVEELQAVVKLLSHEAPLSPEVQQLTAKLWHPLPKAVGQ